MVQEGDYGKQNDATAEQASYLGKRPLLISILCIVAYIFVLLIIAGFFMPETRASIVAKYGLSYVVINGLIAAVGYAGLAGYWAMRRWGIYVYGVMTVLSLAHQLVAGNMNILYHIGHVLILSMGFVYIKRMR